MSSTAPMSSTTESTNVNGNDSHVSPATSKNRESARPHKKGRNSKFITKQSQDFPGHCGDQSIEFLLEFINGTSTNSIKQTKASQSQMKSK